MHEFIDNCQTYEKIIALEVQPDMAEQLRTKYVNNPKVTVENIGISDYEGKARFAFNDQSTCISNVENAVEMDVMSLDFLCSIFRK